MRRAPIIIALCTFACGRLAVDASSDGGDDAPSDGASGLDVSWPSPPTPDAGTAYVPCDACAATLLTSTSYVMNLAADDANVYWSSASQQMAWDEVRKCAIGACVPTTLSTQGAFDVVVKGTSLYTWEAQLATTCTTDCADDASVLAASLNGSLGGFTATASRIFWSSKNGYIDECDPAACALGTTFASNQAAPRELLADDKNLYWINLGSSVGSGVDSFAYSDGGILTCPLDACDGGAPLAAHRDNAGGLAANTSRVFWAEGGSIFACDKTGCGGQPKTLAAFLGNVGRLAVDDAALYFVLGDPVDAGSAAAWRIVKLTLDGSKPPTAITQDQPNQGGYNLALNSHDVFWVAPNGTDIMMTAK